MSVPRLVFALFVVLQAADGVLTYSTVRVFGPAAEANQLIVTWMSLAGIGAAIVGAKALACGCGVVLYVFRVNDVLATLTALYLFGAIVPWVHTLSAL